MFRHKSGMIIRIYFDLHVIHPRSCCDMMINNRKPPVAALCMMFLATAMFSLFTALPAAAQETTVPSKPIGASPGAAASPVKPKTSQTDKAVQQKKPDKTTSKTTGVGASAGGAGTGTSTTLGGVSLKKALIIAGSVVGVVALLVAGGGGGGGGNGGGSTPTH
jgi:hypothetical protein